ncbi:uncharacterized protein LOC106662187 [Cimex lectularius]|uniref:Uncharacterized protein n=1 Tax=Cimex lectularius TaxID=79782 RepID=A0A8I6RBM8_CIMLE|nr:uncharacterized protein LOC106662187 [Cimex lectularius]XP_014241540.1 uncharacterized protein LOC106662187 [Cimex lectularius]XP_014241541.1 uncharacterized protein LOC106662187 [Cimex lectularius]XP_014241542.1 uncharacterized protein LOC106662187 [Cimex lectularius]XP_014241543.1 uncharacterized protein LOC106662187 [Cimex lectularius]XP_024080749.1 uncharacterized protein LOC106662187 [Cimex lectularius]
MESINNSLHPPACNVKASTPTKQSPSLKHMSMISSIGNLSSICSTSQLPSSKIEQAKRAKEDARNKKLLHKSCFQLMTCINAKEKNDSPIDMEIKDLQVKIENKQKTLKKVTAMIKMIPILKEYEEIEKFLIKTLNELSHASILNKTAIQNLAVVKDQLTATRSRVILNDFSPISSEDIVALRKSCQNILNELKKHENDCNSVKNMEMYKVMSSYLQDVKITFARLQNLLQMNENITEQIVKWDIHEKSTDILYKNLCESQ